MNEQDFFVRLTEDFGNLKAENIYSVGAILDELERLDDENTDLRQKLEDMEDDIRDNYRPLTFEEETGISDRMFY